MRIPGLGTDRTTEAVNEVRSALEQAKDGPRDEGVLGNQSIRLVQNILDLGIDGKGRFHSAATVADQALRAAHGDRESAVEAVVRSHVRLGAAMGFVTSLGGFITLPVALPANVLGYYLLATRLTAAVARLRGHDITQEQIRTAILLTLVGADADDLLKKAGMAVPSGGLANLAAQRLPGPAMMVVEKGIGFRLLATVGRSTFTRFGRLVPVVGGAIGGALDSWMMRRVAASARREFPPATPVTVPATPATPVARQVEPA